MEGPIAKDQTSFIFGVRSTYANWLLGLLPSEYEDSRASFQDVNLGISHRIDSSNNLYFSGYFSNDRFALDSDTTYAYTNRIFVGPVPAFNTPSTTRYESVEEITMGL